MANDHDQAAARALLYELFGDLPIKDEVVSRIAAALRAERGKVWRMAVEILETHPNRLLYSRENCETLDYLAQEFRQQIESGEKK